MLYNKNWDKPWAVHKPFSWASVIAWLETKDPTETYDYRNCDECLNAQYHRAIGLEYGFWGALRHLPLEFLACDSPYTFGAALGRAKAKAR